MAHTGRYTTGWIDTSIHELLAGIEEPSSSMAYALITCLDSSPDVVAVVRRNPSLKQATRRFVGQGALLTTRQLLVVQRHQRLFFGFDEIWFFPEADVTPRPVGVFITDPGRITGEAMERLTDWLDEAGCSLGLGDGEGMNFCARVRGVARLLVESLTASEVGRQIAGREPLPRGPGASPLA